MSDGLFSPSTLAKQVAGYFGVEMSIERIIANTISVSRTAKATVFTNAHKELYVFIASPMHLTYADMRKMVLHMNLVPVDALPPAGQSDYFEQYGETRFQEVFPGRSSVSPADIRYYKTLAPYNPALWRIDEVRDGEIYEWDPDSSTSWRLAVKYFYQHGLTRDSVVIPHRNAVSRKNK